MLKFYFKRSTRDVVAHIILLIIPVILIGFFDFIYRESMIVTGISGAQNSFITTLTIGFTLTFQIYAGALSYETIGGDFFSPMKGRLLSSPKEPRSFILSILATGTLVSFLQTGLVLLFSVLLLNAEIPSIILVIAIMSVSILVNQLLGTVILLLTEKVKVATTIMSVYGAVAPMLIGLYFPLPDTRFSDLIKQYLTPMALANKAILSAMEKDYAGMFSGLIPLLLLIVILYMALKPLGKKVIL